MKLIIHLISNKVTTCLFAFSLAFGVCSCSSDYQYDAVESGSVAQLEGLSYQDQIALDGLLNSMNELNAKYPSVNTRGVFLKDGIVGLADAAGYAAGGAIGSWTGAALGSIAGPWGTIAGHLIGRKVGPWVCTFLASGAAGWICSKFSTRTETNTDKEFEFMYVISEKDSIGYFHNQMMAKIKSNQSRYLGLSGTVNYELMYDDIISYLREIGQYDASLEDPLVKLGIINQIKSLCEISEKYATNPTDVHFVKEQCEYLKYNCNLLDSEIKLYKDFSVTLYEKCSTLSNDQIMNYSKDLNGVIDCSDVSEPMKENLKKSADLTINSSLCWNNNL